MSSSADPAPATDDAVTRMMSGPHAAGFIDLGIGEPDQPMPAALVEVAAQSLRDGRTGYTPKLGLPELRALLADDTDTDDAPVDPDDVVVTVGGTGAVAVALMAVGGGVVIPDPAWPNYLVLAQRLGLPVRTYSQGESGDGFFALDEIDAALREGCRLVVVNSPSNPTGAVASPRALEGLLDLARKHGAFVLSDEAYESVVFGGGRAPSPLAVGGADVTFAARTFSKRFSMTGLRLGSLVSPAIFRREVAAIHGTTAGCAPVTAQVTGIAALQQLPDRGLELAAVYADRYARAVGILGSRLPRTLAEDLGGFYLWIDATDTGRSGSEIARTLADAGIGVSAGTVYTATEGYLRASLTAPDADLDRALRRIAAELG